MNQLTSLWVQRYQEYRVGPLGTANVWGLAYDSSSHTTHGLTTDGLLLAVGLSTASTTLIQSIPTGGPTLFGGFEFIEAGGVKSLYFFNLIGNREVIRLDIVGSPPYPITTIGGGDPIRQVSDLAYDSSTGVLYAIDAQQNRLGTVNPTNGVFTPQANNTNVGINNARGIAIDSLGILYGDHAQPNLVTYSFATGLATYIQSTAATRGLIFVPGSLPPTPTPTATPSPTPTLQCLPRDTGDVVNGGFEDNTTGGWSLEFKTCKTAACLDNNLGWKSSPPSGHPGAAVVDTNAIIIKGTTQIATAPLCGDHMVQINDLDGQNHTTRLRQTFSLQNVHPSCGYLRFRWRSLLENPGHRRRQQPAFQISLEQQRSLGFKTTTEESFTAGTSDPNWTNIGNNIFSSTQGSETNLLDFSTGDTWRLSMRARDCSEGGHGGTAFLDCVEVVDWCSSSCSNLFGLRNDGSIFVPNTFTPDNDGLNDIWEVVPREDFCSIEVVIFNRWGSIVYENLIGNSGGYFATANRVALWDGKENQRKKGKNKGRLVPDGTYVARLTIHNCSGSYSLTPLNITVLGGNCKPTPVVSSTKCNRIKQRADLAADSDWRQKVRSLYGTKWDNLSKSKDKRTTCTKQGKKHCCSVSARPCEK